MRASRDPRLLDVVTWSVLHGVKTFRRVHVSDDARLHSTAPIAHFDFACIVPVQQAAFSALELQRSTSVPNRLKVSPHNYDEPVPWLPGVDRGVLSVAAMATQMVLQQRRNPGGGDAGRAAHFSLLADFWSTDDCAAVQQARAACRAAESTFRDGVADPLLLDDSNKGITLGDFTDAFVRVLCGVRRSAFPLWSPYAGQGVRCIGESDFVYAMHEEQGRRVEERGDVVGLLPMLDFVEHSSQPNCTIGVVEGDMQRWLASERGANPHHEYIGLQAARNIRPGERLTVDRNAWMGLSDPSFLDLYGRPWDDNASESAVYSAVAGVEEKHCGDSAATPPSKTSDADIFF